MEQIGIDVIGRSQPKGDKAKMREWKLRNWQGALKQRAKKKQGLGLFKL